MDPQAIAHHLPRLRRPARALLGDQHTADLRFSEEDEVGLVYWIDVALGYVLSGDRPQPERLALATSAHRQLDPQHRLVYLIAPFRVLLFRRMVKPAVTEPPSCAARAPAQLARAGSTPRNGRAKSRVSTRE